LHINNELSENIWIRRSKVWVDDDSIQKERKSPRSSYWSNWNVHYIERMFVIDARRL